MFCFSLVLLQKLDSLENRIEHYAKKRRIDLINPDEAAKRKQDIANEIKCEKMATE